MKFSTTYSTKRIKSKHKHSPFDPVRQSSPQVARGKNTTLKPRTISLRGRQKVFVGLSGGVDSSVAALLLARQGYAVTGVYMKNWSEESLGGKFAAECPWRRDLKDVRKVCKKLRIPLKVYNFEKAYQRRVIDYFFASEIRGETPNPDIICNREIKFGLFLARSLAEGADFIATGHYARKQEVKSQKSKVNIFRLAQAKDKTKDQTYFLSLLDQSQLSHTLFPIGDYTKPQVRAMARAANLPTAEKPESMGICFVGEVKLEDFLKTRISPRPGEIVNTNGSVVGRHQGLPFYTIGQRKGLGVIGTRPWFVVEKRVKTNQIVAAPGLRNPALFKKSVVLANWHWVAGKPRGKKISCLARLRHRQRLQSCRFYPKEKPRVVFVNAQRAVTPGQFCAIYKGGELLGAGKIIKAANAA